MKVYYDRKAKDPTFELGDKVWVYTPQYKPGLSKKLQHRWHGPFRVKCHQSTTNWEAAIPIV